MDDLESFRLSIRVCPSAQDSNAQEHLAGEVGGGERNMEEEEEEA